MLTIVVRGLAMSLVVFTGLRLAYLALYPEFFASLSFLEVLSGLLVGWRFDLSISAVATAFFFLPLLMLPLAPRRQWLITPWLWMAFFMLCLLWLLNLGDLFYFGEVFRHAGKEVVLLTEDYGLMLEVAVSRYGVWLLLLVLALVLLAWMWSRFVVQCAQQMNVRGWRHLVSVVATLTVLVLAARGLQLDGKPIAVVDAYAAGTEKGALLALNGAFSIVHSTRRLEASPKPLVFLEGEKLQEVISRYQWDKEDPFIRHWGIAGEMEKRNVVIVLLESWGASYIDGLAGTNYEATPFFDSLIEKSRVWVNAFAAGQRSIEGIQAVLTSVPVLPNHPVIGWGLEQSRMARLAEIFDSRGYQSVMVQSSNRRSFHVDGIAALAGFDEYFGKEDMPLLREYPQDIPRFGWDYETLMFLATHLENRSDPQRPFLAFAFTGTTHEPFANPGSEFHLHPHESGSEGAYLNTLRYSDWSLEQFMRRMSQQSWYPNTVFVFMADHVMKAGQDIFSSFHIPFLVYTPDGFLPPAKETRFASQYDLLPTLMTLLNVPGAVPAYGRSLLLSDAQGRGVLVHAGEKMFLLDGDGAIPLYGLSPEERLGQGEDELLAKVRIQMADERLRTNQWQH